MHSESLSGNPLPQLAAFSRFGVLVFAALMGLGATNAYGQDLIEFINGSTMKGKILEIRKDAKEFDFESQVGDRQITRTFPYDKVHAVTFNGKRFVLTPKVDSTPDSSPSKATEAKTGDGADGESRTKAEVLRIIEAAGNTPPDWFASTQTNHPATLNLDWPLKEEGKWDESRNVGQYLWGRVNPNASRWKPGIKLVHECMARHQRDRQLLDRDMEKLGDMYFTLLQDYPRAAFWLQKSDASVGGQTGIFLAECYWRLGNKEMALVKLKGTKLHFNAIKLFGDMGEIDKALALTRSYASTSSFNEAFLRAGDALRAAGRYDEAIDYYQKVLDMDKARNPEYLKRYRGVAQGAIEAIKLFDRADVSLVADGKYTASSMGYNGPVEVEVEVADSRIKNVRVSKHQEKQFYAALTDTSKQIIDTQGFKDIDGTSGATITSQAIINATAQAMGKGAK